MAAAAEESVVMVEGGMTYELLLRDVDREEYPVPVLVVIVDELVRV